MPKSVDLRDLTTSHLRKPLPKRSNGMRTEFPCRAASKRWSVVFSKLASMNVDDFIFAMPKRVIPRISPLNVIKSCTYSESITIHVCVCARAKMCQDVPRLF